MKAIYSLDKMYDRIFADKKLQCGWLYKNGEAVKILPGEEIPEGFESEKVVHVPAKTGA